MRRARIGVWMLRWNFMIVASLLLVAGGAAVGCAQQPQAPPAAAAPAAGEGGLTAQDRAEIQDIYAAYTQYFDFAHVDANAMVRQVWTPDGMFVNLSLPNAQGQCEPAKADAPIGTWKPGSDDLIKGTAVDKLGIKVCVGQVTGYDELAWRATNIHKVQGTTWRTMVRRAYIEPIPGGARATAAVVQFGLAKYAGGGWYTDDVVKTPEGWRIKKRVWISDQIVLNWRPDGAKPATE